MIVIHVEAQITKINPPPNIIHYCTTRNFETELSMYTYLPLISVDFKINDSLHKIPFQNLQPYTHIKTGTEIFYVHISTFT